MYTAASVWFTWPLASVATDHVVTQSPVLLNDLFLVLWMLSWVGHALLTDPMRVFDGNAFHPTPQIIAASEHLLGDMPIFLPIWLATDNAILALNCLTLVSFVASALAAHFLARRWTGSTAAAWVAGCAFAFAPWRAALGRPHLLQVQYLPLIAYGLDRVLAGAGTRAALLTALALALQVLCSYYLGYAAYLMAGVMVAVWLAHDGPRAVVECWRGVAIALLVPLVLIVPASIPYLVARSGGALATEFSDPLLQTWELVGRPPMVLDRFAGWGTVLLAVAGTLATYAFARRDRRQTRRVLFLVAGTVAALLLAPGPTGFFDGWVSPYSWLAAVVPGFRSLRSPVRFGILASFLLSILAAYAIAAAERAIVARAGERARTRWFRSLAASLTSLVGIGLASVWLWREPPVYSAFAAPTRDRITPAHRWLAAHGEGAPLLELPVDPMLNVLSARAMFASTYHWLPLLNGYTGYTPRGSALLLAHAQQLPDVDSLQLLVDCTDLRWILLHRASGVRREVWNQLPGVRLEQTFPRDEERRESDVLYRVVLARRPDACPGLFSNDTTATGGPIARITEPRGGIAANVPSVVLPNRERRFAVSLRNDGTEPWPATATDPRDRFLLWYSWQPLDGGDATPWRRVLLARDVAPGETVEITPWIAAPASRGDYLLRMRAGQGDPPSNPIAWQQKVRLEAAR